MNFRRQSKFAESGAGRSFQAKTLFLVFSSIFLMNIGVSSAKNVASQFNLKCKGVERRIEVGDQSKADEAVPEAITIRVDLKRRVWCIATCRMIGALEESPQKLALSIAYAPGWDLTGVVDRQSGVYASVTRMPSSLSIITYNSYACVRAPFTGIPAAKF